MAMERHPPIISPIDFMAQGFEGQELLGCKGLRPPILPAAERDGDGAAIVALARRASALNCGPLPAPAHQR